MNVVYEIVTRVTAPGEIGPLLIRLAFERTVAELPKSFTTAHPVVVGKVRIASTYTTEEV